MKKSKLVVMAHPETGAVITETSNPEFGTVRIDQKVTSVENGFVRINTRSAFLRGKMSDLQTLDLVAGQEFPLPGTLVVKEKTAPWFEGQQPKIAPETNVVCKVAGNAIYRQTEYTSDENAVDTLLAHDNSDEIKAAQAEIKENALKLDA